MPCSLVTVVTARTRRVEINPKLNGNSFMKMTIFAVTALVSVSVSAGLKLPPEPTCRELFEAGMTHDVAWCEAQSGEEAKEEQRQSLEAQAERAERDAQAYERNRQTGADVRGAGETSPGTREQPLDCNHGPNSAC